jgi:Rap1a immunity proteins
VCGKLLRKPVENKGKILPKSPVGVESRNGLEAAVRLLLIVLALLGICFVGSTANTGQKSTPEQPDISRSGRDFLEVCSGIDSEGNREAARTDRNGNGDADRIDRNAPAWRDATCLGWVEGFADGFTVRDELLGVPKRDRIACVPPGVATIQIVRVIKKYLADNPAKAHRPTRYIASLALAGAFPCKAGK